MEEIWKNIPGFEGYQASNLGRIKSLKCGREKFIGSDVKVTDKYTKRQVNVNGKTTSVGVFVLMTFDRLPNKGEECDHIDRNPLNNQITNLRWVTKSVNNMNKSGYGKSNYKGVYYKSRKNKKGESLILAKINYKKEQIYLGTFKSEQEAYEAYKTAFKKLYGYEWI